MDTKISNWLILSTHVCKFLREVVGAKLRNVCSLHGHGRTIFVTKQKMGVFNVQMCTSRTRVRRIHPLERRLLPAGAGAKCASNHAVIMSLVALPLAQMMIPGPNPTPNRGRDARRGHGGLESENDLKPFLSSVDSNQHHVYCIDHGTAHALRQDRDDDHCGVRTRDQSTGRYATGA
jgi:hypothetical protein